MRQQEGAHSLLGEDLGAENPMTAVVDSPSLRVLGRPVADSLSV